MIVHTPTIQVEEDKVYISSRFELKKPLPFLPQELWYRFPQHYHNHISMQADAFAPTALLLAMYTGEDLQIRGKISPRLAYSLYEYQKIFSSWWPKLFFQIDIQYQHLAPPVHLKRKTAVATAFSGGVDSFYTLWSHLPQNQSIPDAQITHGLFVHGLDLRLDDEENYWTAAELYRKIYKDLGLDLIQVATNAYLFSEFRIDWTIFHGTALIGAALCLSPFLKRFYVPSSMSDYNRLVPFGSTPLIDHLLSTETVQIVNHGTNVTRTEKTITLVSWPITHHKLRVCANRTSLQGLKNCCTCQKCYRMMVLLEILEAREKYQNFSKNMNFFKYVHWGLLNQLDPLTARELRDNAFRSGRIVMAMGIQLAIILDIFSNRMARLLKRLLSQDQLYRIKQVIFKPESNLPIQNK